MKHSSPIGAATVKRYGASMTTSLAIALLVATLVLGVAAGLLYLQRRHKPLLVRAHLVLALASVGVVALLALSMPSSGGPPAALPLVMLGIAVALGWGAPRIPRLARQGRTLMLAGHAVLGVAGFLVFLAWVKTL